MHCPEPSTIKVNPVLRLPSILSGYADRRAGGQARRGLNVRDIARMTYARRAGPAHAPPRQSAFDWEQWKAGLSADSIGGKNLRAAGVPVCS